MNKNGHKHGGHLWMMILCCLVPILLVVLVKNSSFSGSGWITAILPFLCPIFMVVMMFSCFKGSAKKAENGEAKQQQGSCH